LLIGQVAAEWEPFVLGPLYGGFEERKKEGMGQRSSSKLGSEQLSTIYLICVHSFILFTEAI